MQSKIQEEGGTNAVTAVPNQKYKGHPNSRCTLKPPLLATPLQIE